MQVSARLLSALLIGVAEAAYAQGTSGSPTANIQVELVTDEADQALAILEARVAGRPIAPNDWERLFATEGYRALKKREAAMGRQFSDADFQAFLKSDSLRARTQSLARALGQLHRLDPRSAATRALAYLPAGTPLKARLFLEIKPRTNSFVFDLDGTRAIFLYVNPAERAEQVENTMAHELHHVGISAACHEVSDSMSTPEVRDARMWASALGEGLAMLAAAGGPDVHPQATSDSATQARWDRDVANFAQDRAELEGFFTDVLDGRLKGDSLTDRAMTYFGIQGPWYTVGWRMGQAVEKVHGRPVLISAMCDPVRFFSAYNEAAEVTNRRGEMVLPLWSPDLIRRLKG